MMFGVSNRPAMPQVAAVRDAVIAKTPDVSPTLIGPAAVAGVLVTAVALAGAKLGTTAIALAIPAALAAAVLKRRVEARQEGLRLLSQQDALTGLGNRRLLHERLGYEIARHRRHGRRFTLMALDLDGFKQVNDRFGHLAGDEILREVARSLQRAVREQDTVVRIGGDEFCILVPESAWEDADRMAGRLGRAVASAVGGLDTLSVSVGYAVFPDEGWTPEHLMARADAAGIETKRRPRRRRAA
jgi:diguanylate cyclase (GGDEF)-like protein